jgi:hypothetical protein
MSKADHSDTTRRRFLASAVAAGAGSTVLALATIPIPPTQAAAAPAGLLDPVFSLIEAHRTARAAYDIALAEHTRLEQIGDPAADLISEAPCDAQMDAFHELIETAPITFAGLQAWSSYLNEIQHVEAWMFEEAGPTLIVTLAEALTNLSAAA